MSYRYAALTDHMLKRIEFSTDEALAPARAEPTLPS
jgi:hypothetical protein